jgi:hypothetical protein
MQVSPLVVDVRSPSGLTLYGVTLFLQRPGSVLASWSTVHVAVLQLVRQLCENNALLRRAFEVIHAELVLVPGVMARPQVVF